MKVGVDLHRGSKFVKLPSSFKNMSSINFDTLWFGCMGVWEIVVSGIFDFSVPLFLKLITPSCDLIQKNCLYTDLDMTLDNEFVGVTSQEEVILCGVTEISGFANWLKVCHFERRFEALHTQ